MGERKKLLILFGEQKKVVFAQSSDSISEIFFAVREIFSFGSKSFVLQHFDCDFDEWIDANSTYIPEDKEKLRIVECARTSSDDAADYDDMSIVSTTNCVLVIV